MNDDQFEGLDTRAKTAAESVQAATQRRPRPAFDADRPMTLPQPAAVGHGRAPRRSAWVAAAAVVALVAGAVTFAVTRPGDGKDSIAATAVEDPRPFVADNLPDGLGPMAFMDLDAGLGGEPLASAMPVYGKTPEEPLAGATVLEQRVFDELELKSSDVDGLTLYRNKGEASLPGQWVGVKDAGAFVIVFGATDDDAVALARTVSVVDGVVSVDSAALPDGWRRLVTVQNPVELMGMSIRGGSSGFLAYYSSENADTSIQIASIAGTEASMWAGRLFVSDSREVTVRGHRAFAGSYPMPDASGDSSSTPQVTVVAWLERPGEVLGMIGINVSEDELLAAAESIRPADGDEWRDLVEQSQLGSFGGFFDENGNELGRVTGTFDDGTKWSLIVTGFPAEEGLPEGVSTDPGFYTELRVALSGDGSGSQGSSSSSHDGLDVFRSVDTTDVGGRFFSSGLVGDEVARVELQTADGAVLGDAQMVEVAKLRAYVTELTEDPTVLVAFRADGSEVGRVTIEALADNVTVDMDGIGQGQVSTFEGKGIPVDSEGNPIIDPVQPTETTEPTGDQPPG